MSLHKGLVMKSTGSNYLVKIEDKIIDCKIKGNLRLKEIKITNPLTVGDRVWVEIESSRNFGLITKREERENYLIRKSTNLSREAHVIAANIDNAFLVTSLILPEVSMVFMDRFLVACEAYKVPANIIFNKIDLYSPELLKYLDEIISVYEKIGYVCYKTSAERNIGIERFLDILKDKISIFSGNSGVGKSSLIRKIDSRLNLKVQEISNYHLKGKHTTTFYEMFELQTGGMIIDSPGIKGFGMVDLEKENIANYFPEMLNLIENCQYYNCTHTHEPNCAVKKAVENGEIAFSRYNSYLSILEGEEDKYRKR